jgi:putative FmdB family regulatory protein
MICLQMTGNRNSGREGSMATYEYRCNDCGETFEQRETIAEHETAKPKCPKCGGEKVARAFSAFYANTAKKS